MRALIEDWFPAAAVGAESLRERGSAKAYPPINFLHVWWARRPLAASRAAVIGSLLPAWPTSEECEQDERAHRVHAELQRLFPDGEMEYHTWFLHSLGIAGDPVAARARIEAARAAGTTTEGNAYGYDRAFSWTPDPGTVRLIHDLAALRANTDVPPSTLDPFAGGGAIPFEAARYGFTSLANELNPVAAAILQGTVVLPADLRKAFSATLERYGTDWARRIESRLDAYFPLDQAGDRPAYIWAHTVPCPTTGRPTPLAPDFWLARGKAGRDVAVSLQVDEEEGTYELGIVEGAGANQWGDRSTYKSGVASSIWTGQTFSGEYIQDQAKAGHMGEMLLAVSVTRPGARGRQFRAPTSVDLAAVAAASAELQARLPGWEVDGLVPDEPINPGHKTDEPRRVGLLRWRDLFTDRQLISHLVALEELLRIGREAREQLPPMEADAVALYLAFALDKAIDYNSELASWDATRIKMRNTFDRHDLAFKWTFAEFDGAHALYQWAANNAVLNDRKIRALLHAEATLLSEEVAARAEVNVGSATALPYADRSVDAVVTDPPYYDNVIYSEISDFFYVWLKRSLRDAYPQFTTLALTEKQAEAVANPSLFAAVAAPARRGRRRSDVPTATELADAHYEDLLAQSFQEANRVLKDDGVLTVMFTHKRVEAWDTLGMALLQAGFTIESSWPVHTESEHSLHQAKKNSAQSTILLSCRKRLDSEPAYWADIRGDVERAAESAARELADAGMTGVDLTLATYGPVLSVLSRRWPVYTGNLTPDGESEVLRPDAALDLAREKVVELKKQGLLGGRAVDFDRLTDWWLLAWSDFQAAEFPYDEARKLGIALHLDVEDVTRAKLARKSSGTVTLLTPAQRRTAGGLDPDATLQPTLVDALHTLMLLYDEDGLAAAEQWLRRSGYGDEQTFRDLVRAALHAVPRAHVKGGFARPEARILEGLRTTLFEEIPAPIDPTPDVNADGGMLDLDFGDTLTPPGHTSGG
jgi:adenine-specific DNA methylase